MFRDLIRLNCFSYCVLAVAVFTGTAISPGACLAQELQEVFPDDERVEAVQHPNEFFGFAMGSRHLRHHEVVDYMKHLADVSDRARLKQYGMSHGRRPVLALVITSPKNLQQLEKIRKQHRQLSSGSVLKPRPDDHLVMYLGYGVHGDEPSAMNAAVLVAWHLASSKSPEVAEWLDRSVYLVDPALNPDGNERFANWVNENRGRIVSSDPMDREHRQAWPGGRTNYYWFDLNRDWLPLTHPESAGRIRLYHQWKPNVVLDYHEMGSDASYFFQPGIPERTNPLTPKRNVVLTQRFAQEHAKRMDDAGELFFTEERFDDFYIGKGSTYPDVHGCIGILFEQGSARGMAMKTERTQRTFADAIANQVRTSLSSLHAAHRMRKDLLQYQCEFYENAMQKKAGMTAYVLNGEPSRISIAQSLLQRHDVQCFVPADAINVDGFQVDAGRALVVPMPQPESTFVRSLMEIRQQFRENIFYDVSTWHLPSALDLQSVEITHDLPESWTQESDATDVAVVEFSGEQMGFAVPPTSLLQAKVIAALNRTNARLRVAMEPFSTSVSGETQQFAAGTVLVLKQPNSKAWSRIVQRLNQMPGGLKALVHPLATSQTSKGPDLGSGAMVVLKPSRPAIVVGEGTDRYVAGAIWHHLDVRVGQPTTLLNTIDLARADLQDYSCVILPSGSYGDWGDRQADNLQSYVNGGGTLIAIGSAAKWLDSAGVTTLPEVDFDGKEEEKQGRAVRFGEARDAAALERVAGAFFESHVDGTHPLAFGFEDELVPVFRNQTLRFEPAKNPYQTAAVYGDVIAGYVSQKNRKRLKGSAAVFAIPKGDGRVIVLADNPVFRGYVRSTEPFLMNAIYIGPSLDIPSAP